MNGVIGMTDAAARHAAHRRAARIRRRSIRSSGDSLLTIINDILDFSKIESGKIELETHPFNLRQCIEEAMELLAPQGRREGLDLVVAIEPGVPIVVVGDVTRLRQVLVNLIGNAIKFTAQGEVVVTVGDGGGSARREFASISRGRYRHRHPDGEAGPSLPVVQPGGQLDDASVRRHGPGPGDQQAPGRAHGRLDVGGERSRTGFEVHDTFFFSRFFFFFFFCIFLGSFIVLLHLHWIIQQPLLIHLLRMPVSVLLQLH